MKNTFSARIFLACGLFFVCNLASFGSEPTPADVVGPDGVIYPNWKNVGVEGGIPNVAVRARLADFGGVPNDGKDDSEALAKAMETVGRDGGGALLLDEGRYLLTRPVVCFWDGVVVRGEGPERTKIVFDYLPDDGVDFFLPAADSTIQNNAWIEIHAKPDGLNRLAIEVDGDEVASREKSKHWGGTYSLSTTSSRLLRGREAGTATLRAVAKYDDGSTVTAERSVEFPPQSERRNAPSSVARYVGAITFAGENPFGPRYRLSQDAQRGDMKLRLGETGDLKAGDIVVLEAPKTDRWDALVQNACRWGSYRRNEYRISAIDGKTVSIEEPLRIPFPTIDGSYVQRFRPIEKCGVEGLSIEQKQKLWTSGVIFSSAWNCWARDVHVLKAGRWPVYLSPAKHGEIRDCVFEDAWYHGGGGTAYVGFERAYDCLLDTVRTNKMRHAPCVQWSASGNVIRNSVFIQSDGQWHAGWTNENLFENCVIDAKRGTGSYGHGFWASPPEDQAHGPNGPRNVVWGCDVKAPRTGVWMGGMNHDWLILYNRIVCDEGPAIFMKTNSDGHRIANNVFVLNKRESAAFTIQSNDCDGVEIRDNTVYGDSVRMWSGKGTPSVKENNKQQPLQDIDSVPMPAKPVPSIFEWQRNRR